MKLYLIRHGEALDDIEDCYGGIADFPLTDNGRGQARRIADRLCSAGLQAIFTSPLVRARETAEIISNELRINVSVVEGLKERNSYGVLSGVNKERASQIFRHILKDLKEKPGYSREPLLGAEDFDDFLLRVNRAFHEVIDFARNHRMEHIAIVTHGKFTQALLEHVLKIEKKIDLELSAVNVVDYQPAIATLDANAYEGA